MSRKWFPDQNRCRLRSPFILSTSPRSRVWTADLTSPKEGTGADQSRIRCPTRQPKRPSYSLAKFLGSGACIIDYDGDGKPDIFLVNDGKGFAALYRNLGNGKFANVTKAAKLELYGEGTSCAVGDYDNDGKPDLAVAINRHVHLFTTKATAHSKI